jgi:hypothetical protein
VNCRAEIVRLLLQRGAVKVAGWTVLDAALSKGHADTITALLEKQDSATWDQVRRATPLLALRIDLSTEDTTPSSSSALVSTNPVTTAVETSTEIAEPQPAPTNDIASLWAAFNCLQTGSSQSRGTDVNENSMNTKRRYST